MSDVHHEPVRRCKRERAILLRRELLDRFVALGEFWHFFLIERVVNVQAIQSVGPMVNHVVCAMSQVFQFVSRIGFVWFDASSRW